jgi:Flp pilus assembly protein TadD
LLPIALIASALTHAQAASPIPAEPTVEERRAYNQGLAEARKLLSEQQWARASARLDTLLKERPREAQARFLKGVVETEQGQTDMAIGTFRDLIADYPEIPEPYNNLAVLYARNGDIEGARMALETAVKTAPEWAVAHENLGDVYARMAVEQYDRAATLDRANATVSAKLKLARELIAPKP